MDLTMIYVGSILGFAWFAMGISDLFYSRADFQNRTATEPYDSMPWTFSLAYGLTLAYFGWCGVCVPGMLENEKPDTFTVIGAIFGTTSILIGSIIIGEHVLRTIAKWWAPEIIYWKISDIWRRELLFPDIQPQEEAETAELLKEPYDYCI